MAGKHPGPDQIQSMLREGHFGPSRDHPPADPLSTTQMLVEIDRIESYERNPRKERNPRYDEIKASIRAQGGLNNPLTITRRPGNTLYIVEAGGNTRLQILKELWQDTGDDRFYRIHCLFRPWVSESHVLTAHLIENDKRGELTFIDKALGIRALREVMAAERNITFSQRQLVDALSERGYGLDQGTLSRMDYAVDILLPIIPEALRTGMGMPLIRRIRRLDTACRNFWDDLTALPERFEPLFSETLASHDGPHWDLEAAQRDLEYQMAELTGLSLKQVRLEIDARLASDHNEPEPLPSVRTGDPAAPGAAPPPVPGEPRSVTASQATPAEPAAPPAPAPADVTGPGTVIPGSDGTPSASPEPDDAPPVTTPAPPADDGPRDLKSLRSRSYVLALRIARRHDLEDCVTPAGQLGMGYLVDLPGESLIPVAGEDQALRQLYRQWIWWLLLSFCEESVQPERLAQAPEELLLRTLVLEDNDNQALALVGEPDWKALGYEFLNNPAVPQATVDELLALAQTCRRIRQQGQDDGGLVLWEADGERRERD